MNNPLTILSEDFGIWLQG